MKTKNIATIYAILAAALYAINVPMSKILLNYFCTQHHIFELTGIIIRL